MKTKLTYIAEDGTSFDTEKECAEYEEKLANKYVVLYKDKETNLIKREFYNEPLAKRYIANSLHECYENCIVGDFKLIHCGKTVEFNSNELARFVPAHHNIDGDKLDEVFKLSATKEIKIPGYTLHGDYYLSDTVITIKDWKRALELKEVIDLPNGKKILARTLTKEELESIPQEERRIGYYWYWTITTYDSNGNYAWNVESDGNFSYDSINLKAGTGGVRLGFKNPFAN